MLAFYDSGDDEDLILPEVCYGQPADLDDIKCPSSFDSQEIPEDPVIMSQVRARSSLASTTA